MSTWFSTPEMNAMDRKPSGGGALDADTKFRLKETCTEVVGAELKDHQIPIPHSYSPFPLPPTLTYFTHPNMNQFYAF